MHHSWRRSAALAAFVWLALQGSAQAQYATNFDLLLNGSTILTNTTGAGQWMGLADATATVSNNTYTFGSSTYSNYVVFQGEISNLFSRVAPDGNNDVSAQLLIQATWSDAMPDGTVCPDRQGGVCFSNGDVYAWATNGWLKLMNTNGPAISVPSNTWTKLSFVANYTGAGFGSPTNIVFYKVYINSTNMVPVDLASRYSHGSPFAADTNGAYIQSSALYDPSNKGIQGFYMSGSGTMDTLQSQAGLPAPLSSAIDIRAYQGSDGVYVEFKTYSEEGAGTIYLQLKDAGGNVIWQGSQPAKGSGNNLYRFQVPGLQLGGTYSFTVIDEAGKGWSKPNVTVAAFMADMLRMSPVGVTLQFGTIPDRQYEVQWSRQLGGTWQAVTNLKAVYSQSSVFVFFPDPAAPSGFFRIVLK